MKIPSEKIMRSLKAVYLLALVLLGLTALLLCFFPGIKS